MASTLGTRYWNGRTTRARELDFNGRLMSVKRLEDEEDDKSFLITLEAPRFLPIWTHNH